MRYADIPGGSGRLAQALGVPETISPLARLKASLTDSTGVYVNAGVNPGAYYAALAEDIQRNQCKPFEVSAVVTLPGFPHYALGSTIRAICVAHRAGYWLVYEPERDEFMCFWGTSTSNLSAPGIYGAPLYCWSS